MILDGDNKNVIFLGQGFNDFRESIIVSCSLNGHTLRTDPVSAKDAPLFDSELVWETDRRALRRLV